ncbi:hypothetical protein QBC39DRAFT_434105 [Podospora conica]|nr:hypothetical protein QBC39DRAFT_434105 [Schizothecium conicum]
MQSSPEKMEWDLVLDGFAPKQGGTGTGTSPSMTSTPMSPMSALSPPAKDNSVPGNSTYGVDPPRPAKEGKNSFSPNSPYLTEEAHVLSLQRARDSPLPIKGEDEGWLAPKHSISSTTGKAVARLVETTTSKLPLHEPRPSLFHHLSWRNFGPARLRSREGKKPAAKEESNVIESSSAAPSGGGLAGGGAELPFKPSRQVFGGRRIRFGKGLKDDGSATEVPSPAGEEVSPTASSDAAVKMDLLLAPPKIWANEYPAGASDILVSNPGCLLTQHAQQEAIRVDTPPLKEATADGKPRGLFFDVSGPSSDSGPGGSESTSTRASKKERQKSEAQEPAEPKRRREWWDPYPKTLAAATTTAASRRDLIRKAAAFEFDVPEHLPNSPMCPANPKHKSGGKGVCVVVPRSKEE